MLQKEYDSLELARTDIVIYTANHQEGVTFRKVKDKYLYAYCQFSDYLEKKRKVNQDIKKQRLDCDEVVETRKINHNIHFRCDWKFHEDDNGDDVDKILLIFINKVYDDFDNLISKGGVNVAEYHIKKEDFRSNFQRLDGHYFENEKKLSASQKRKFASYTHGHEEELFRDFSSFGKDFIRYLDKEWFAYDHCFAMAYKGQHMTYLLKGTKGTNNACEGMIGDMKKYLDSKRIDLRALVEALMKYSRCKYDQFEGLQSDAMIKKPSDMELTLAQGLFDNITRNVSLFGIEHMFKKLERGVGHYVKNEIDMYKNTCTILKCLITRYENKQEKCTLSEEKFAGVKSSDGEFFCSCITQGLYCVEYLMNCCNGGVDGNNLPYFIQQWEQKEQDAVVMRGIKKVEAKDISSQWKVVSPKGPVQINNKSNHQSVEQKTGKRKFENQSRTYKKNELVENRRKYGIFERFLINLRKKYADLKYKIGLTKQSAETSSQQSTQHSTQGSTQESTQQSTERSTQKSTQELTQQESSRENVVVDYDVDSSAPSSPIRKGTRVRVKKVIV